MQRSRSIFSLIVAVMILLMQPSIVDAASEISTPGEYNTAVTAIVEPNFTVLLPASTDFKSGTKKTESTIGVKGDNILDHAIRIKPISNKILMKYNSDNLMDAKKDDVEATITITKTCWLANELLNAKDEYVCSTVTCEADKLSAGKWAGVAAFEIKNELITDAVKNDLTGGDAEKLLAIGSPDKVQQYMIPSMYCYKDIIYNPTTVDKTIFIGNKELQLLYVPSNIKEIKEDFISEVKGTVVEVYLNDGLEKIGNNAFADCANMKRIRVPDTVTEIGENAFKGIEYLYYDGTATGAPWGATNLNVDGGGMKQ